MSWSAKYVCSISWLKARDSSWWQVLQWKIEPGVDREAPSRERHPQVRQHLWLPSEHGKPMLALWSAWRSRWDPCWMESCRRWWFDVAGDQTHCECRVPFAHHGHMRGRERHAIHRKARRWVAVAAKDQGHCPEQENAWWDGDVAGRGWVGFEESPEVRRKWSLDLCLHFTIWRLQAGAGRGLCENLRTNFPRTRG